MTYSVAVSAGVCCGLYVVGSSLGGSFGAMMNVDAGLLMEHDFCSS